MSRLVPITLIAPIVIAACGAGNAAGDLGPLPGSDAGTTGTPQCFSSSECPVGFVCSEFGVCVAPPPPGDAMPPPPPETEYKLSDPVSSRRFVWVAMADQDRLAKIDGATLEVASLAVGDRPEVLATLPGTDTAVVLDSNNGAATVVRATTTTTSADLFPTLPNLNRMATTPGGRYAVAFFDLAKAIRDAGSIEAVHQVGSFQDVTLLAVGDGAPQRSVDLTVGFRPREVEADAAGRYAFVITDDGVSVVDLPVIAATGSTIVPPIRLTADPFGDHSGLEVDVVASGQFAVVRAPNTPQLRVVTLLGPTAGVGVDLTLPGIPTDIDLAPDGTRVYAVIREPASLEIIDIPGDVTNPAGITHIPLANATSGSLVLSGDGKRGLLFTNASLDERITVVDLDQPTFPHRTFPLQKAVLTAGFDPSGTKAVILHARAPGDPDQATSLEEYIDRKPGYSVFDIASGFAKLQITEVNPQHFAFAGSAPRAYVTLDGGDTEGAFAAVQQIELDSGVVRTIALGSPPAQLGLLPETNKIFVSQRHPLGRVTFIDTATNEVRTVTGFDLNSQIID